MTTMDTTTSLRSANYRIDFTKMTLTMTQRMEEAILNHANLI